MTTAPAQPVSASGLGPLAIGFLVISAASPLAVVLGSAPLALLFGGPAAGLGFLVIGALLALFSVSFLPMTKYVASPGAYYSYVARGLGGVVGSGAALMTLLSYLSLAMCGFALFGVYGAQTALFATGATVPWWIPALVCVAVVAVLGQLGIRVNAVFLGALLVVEMIVLATIAVCVLVQGGADGLSLDAFAPQNVLAPGMAIAILFAFASCLGLESTVVYRSESRNPVRTIPRALFGVITFVALFHAFFLWLMVQAGGSAMWESLAADPAGTFLALADRFAGSWASPTLGILVLASILASCLAFHNMLNRYTRTLAEDGLLPSGFARVSRRGVPWLGGAVQIALALIVVAVSVGLQLDPYLQTYILVSTPGAFGMVVMLGLTSLAAFVFFVRTREAARRGILIGTSALATLALGGLVVLTAQQLDYLTGLGPVVNTLLVMPPLAAFVIGLAIAVARRRRTQPMPVLAPHPEQERVRTAAADAATGG